MALEVANTPLEQAKAKVRTYAKDESLNAAALKAVDMDTITAQAKAWLILTPAVHHAFRKVALELELTALSELGDDIVAGTTATSFEIQRGGDGNRELIVR